MEKRRICSLVMALLCFSGVLQAQVNPKERLWQTLKAIQENYVDSLSDTQLVEAAIAGMMKVLDPHSRYFSKQESQEMQEFMKGQFAGIGIQYMMENDSLFVTQVMEGSPASKAGLQAGDRILRIDSQAVTGSGQTNYSVMKKIRGQKGSPLSLEILRKYTGSVMTKELVRDFVADRSLKTAYMLDKKTGYIAIRIFNETTRQEMDRALIALKKQGMQNLVLDLQGNGGGYVQSAIGVADEFLQKDQLVFYSEPRDKGRDYYYSGGFGQFPEGKLVVLIDQSTASASEILTGALQDWDRAVIIGRRSFGKGLMQRPVPVFDGSVLELTGARYYTPSGRSIQKPYKGAVYEDDPQTRLASGELTNGNIFHFPDSLKFRTLVNKRTVYGGGGIMPDIYVPFDTLELNSWLQQITASGLAARSGFNYLDANRTRLLETYKDFDSFNKQYVVPDSLLQLIIAAGEKAGIKLPAPNRDRILQMFALELKAQLASQLYAGSDHYLQVMNAGNASLKEALRILEQSSQFSKILKP